MICIVPLRLRKDNNEQEDLKKDIMRKGKDEELEEAYQFGKALE